MPGITRGDGEDRKDWRNREAQERCDQFARRHGMSLREENGVVTVEVDGMHRVLHEASDRQLVWAETFLVLIALLRHHPFPALPPPMPTPQRVAGQKLTREQRRSAQIATFLKQYARKAHAGSDPNDRQYSRKIEAKVKRMRPEDFDYLLHGLEEDGEDARHRIRGSSQRVPVDTLRGEVDLLGDWPPLRPSLFATHL